MDEQILAPAASGDGEFLVASQILLQQIHGALPRNPVLGDDRHGLGRSLLLVGQAPELDCTGSQDFDGRADALAQFRASNDYAFAPGRPAEGRPRRRPSNVAGVASPARDPCP